MSLNECLEFIANTDAKTLEQICQAVEMAEMRFNPLRESTDKPKLYNEQINSVPKASSTERFSPDVLRSTGMEIHIKLNK